MSDVLELFPELTDNFKQRKNYHEYYYTPGTVDININKIQDLTEKMFFTVIIDHFTIILK